MLTWKIRYDRGEHDDDDPVGRTLPKSYTEEWDTAAVPDDWEFIDLSLLLPGAVPLTLEIDGRNNASEAHKVVFGSSQRDEVEGSEVSDHLYGMAGNDVIDGKGGNDYIEGGLNNDVLKGDEGHDKLHGMAGDDELIGGTGDDLLYGGSGNDTYRVNSGVDRDLVYDSDGNGAVYVLGLGGGEQGIRLGNGNYVAANTWTSEDSKFRYVLSADTDGTNTLYVYPMHQGGSGGGGYVRIRNFTNGHLGINLEAPDVIPESPDDIRGDTNPKIFEDGNYRRDLNGNLVADPNLGTSFRADVLFGNANNNYINGYTGNDSLHGRDGNDSIYGESGHDFITGGLGDDRIFGGVDNDSIYADDSVPGEAPLTTDLTLPNPEDIDSHLYSGIGWATYESTWLKEAQFTYDTVTPVLLHLEYERFKTFFSTTGRSVWTAYGQKEGGNDYIDAGTGDDFVSGGYGSDELRGGTGKDTLWGGSGGDQIYGGDDNDLLMGDAKTHQQFLVDSSALGQYALSSVTEVYDDEFGADSLFGGSGDDYMFGMAGNDTLEGEAGNDYIVGDFYETALLEIQIGTDAEGHAIWGFDESTLVQAVQFHGDDLLDGGEGNDTLVGLAGDDTLEGGVGDDILLGDGRLDDVQGRYGNDQLDGQEGNDYLQGFGGDDKLIGGEGVDVLWGDERVADTDPELLMDQSLHGKDYLEGGDGDDLLYGGGADDRLLGGDGKDLLIGDGAGITNEGSDQLFGGTGNDELQGGGGNDFLYGEQEDDKLFGEGGDDSLDGGAGKDYLSGGDGIDQLLGGDGGDTIYGEAGKDLIAGGKAADYLAGGADDDTYLLNRGELTFEFESHVDPVTGTYSSTKLAETIEDSEGNNRIKFGAGISYSDLTLQRGANPADLVVNISATEGVIIKGGMQGAVTHFEFASGEVVGWSDLVASGLHEPVVLTPQAGHAAIGGTGNDVITLQSGSTARGGAGNDWIALHGGGNTLVYNLGDGSDRVSAAYTATPATSNTLRFGAGIAASDLKLSLTEDLARNLVIQVGSSNASTIEVDFTAADPLGVPLINTLEFADGSTLSLGDFIVPTPTGFRITQQSGGTSESWTEYRSDGTKQTSFSDDGEGYVVTTTYDANGYYASDVWTKANHSHGMHTWEPGVGLTGVTYYDDGSGTYSHFLDSVYSSVTTTDFYTADGFKFKSEWVNVNTQESGVNTYKQDGSYVVVSTSFDFLTTTTEYSAQNIKIKETLVRPPPHFPGTETRIYYPDGRLESRVWDWGNASNGSGSENYYPDGSFLGIYRPPSGGVGITTKGADGSHRSEFFEEDGFLSVESWYEPGVSWGNYQHRRDGSSYGSWEPEFAEGSVPDWYYEWNFEYWDGAVGVERALEGGNWTVDWTKPNGISGTLTYWVDGRGNSGQEIAEWSTSDGASGTAVFDLTDMNDGGGASVVSESWVAADGSSGSRSYRNSSDWWNVGYFWSSMPGAYQYKDEDYEYPDERAGYLASEFWTDLDGVSGTRVFVYDASGKLIGSDWTLSDGTSGFESFGTDTVNAWVGTAQADAFSGFAGNDSLSGAGGNDILRGGNGNDLLSGGDGNDRLYGGAGADTMSGGQGDDTYFVDDMSDSTLESDGQGNDRVLASISHTLSIDVEDLYLTGGLDIDGSGNALDNRIQGNSGSNVLSGGAGDDLLLGEAGDDVLSDDAGVNVLEGGDGNDQLIAIGGVNTLRGGEGDDLYVLGAVGQLIEEAGASLDDKVELAYDLQGATYQLADGIEHLAVTATQTQAVTLAGNAGDNTIDASGVSGVGVVLEGGAGNDTLTGNYSGGADATFVFAAGFGQDIVAGGNVVRFDFARPQDLELSVDGNALVVTIGDDEVRIADYFSNNSSVYRLEFEAANGAVETLDFNAVDNLLNPSTTNEIFGDEYGNTLTGTSGADSVYAGAGNDTVSGGDGNDILHGEGDADYLYGEDGSDIAYGGEGNDGVGGGAGADVVYGDGGNDILIDHLYNGGPHSDGLVDVLHGGEGVDTFYVYSDLTQAYGDAGSDQLHSYTDHNELYGGADNDTLSTSGSYVLMDGGDGNDVISVTIDYSLPSTGNTLRGGAGDDTLSGGIGATLLDGGDGNDVLNGGRGDTLLGGAGDDLIGAIMYEYAPVTADGGDGSDTYRIQFYLTTAAELSITDSGTGSGEVDTLELVSWSSSPLISSFTLMDTVENLTMVSAVTAGFTLIGNAADNVISANGNTGYVLDGGAGNDTLLGGAGTIYRFGAGFGQDAVNTGGAAGVVRFLFERPEELALSASGNALLLQMGSDQVSVADYFNGNASAYTIEFVAADGSVETLGYNAIYDLLNPPANNGEIVGDSSDNILSGTEAADVMYGRAGHDSMNAGAGDDAVYGEAGNDGLAGGAGADVVDGGDGDDFLFDSSYGVVETDGLSDTLYGGDGNDQVMAYSDLTVAYGGAGNDAMDAANSGATLHGGEGNDYLSVSGGTGSVLYGDAGDDTLVGIWGSDTLHGGDGNDELQTGLDGVDALYGGAGNDTLRLQNNSGSGTADGGEGSDTYVVGYQNVTFSDSGTGAGDIDTVVLANNFTQYGLAVAIENLTITGWQSGGSVFAGNAGANVIDASASYGSGLVLEGGAGNDALTGNSGTVFRFNSGFGQDVVSTNGAGGVLRFGFTRPAGFTLQAGASGGVVLGFGTDTVTVGDYANGNYAIEFEGQDGEIEVLSAAQIAALLAGESLPVLPLLDDLSGADAVLTGTSGNDTLTGGTGVEVVFGRAGNDTVSAGDGNDRVYGGGGDDTVYGEDGADQLRGGVGHDSMNGGAGADALYGEAGNDGLAGGAGADVVDGGDGDDFLMDHLYAVVETDGLVDTLYGGDGNDQVMLCSDLTVAYGGAGNDAMDAANSGATLHGGEGNDYLSVSGGTGSVLYGDAGDDTLVGSGATTYRFGQGDGADTIVDANGLADDDRIEYGSGIAYDQLWFAMNGNSLEISVIGTGDKVTVSGWGLGAANRIETIQVVDGHYLLENKVQQLVDAMASMTPPTSGQTTLSAQQQQDLAATFSQTWQTS
ncbi:MAG: HlyJ hemolysin-like protein [Moraxellaceae bacterium]|nr:HlyJ hemolysin-like protein [Moraxellaceae bacterium]